MTPKTMAVASPDLAGVVWVLPDTVGADDAVVAELDDEADPPCAGVPVARTPQDAVARTVVARTVVASTTHRG